MCSCGRENVHGLLYSLLRGFDCTRCSSAYQRQVQLRFVHAASVAISSSSKGADQDVVAEFVGVVRHLGRLPLRFQWFACIVYFELGGNGIFDSV